MPPCDRDHTFCRNTSEPFLPPLVVVVLRLVGLVLMMALVVSSAGGASQESLSSMQVHKLNRIQIAIASDQLRDYTFCTDMSEPFLPPLAVVVLRFVVALLVIMALVVSSAGGASKQSLSFMQEHRLNRIQIAIASDQLPAFVLQTGSLSPSSAPSS